MLLDGFLLYDYSILYKPTLIPSQVHEDTAETGKPGFVNFKNAVWHGGFEAFLEKIARHSETGCSVNCGDGQERWLWPIILILSADYEEM